ncbi:hypothetical protein, partial [uncultured Duncaniella sp.]|uniref:hypothetical protein n=1 Tax=uncultured Duncaniella sp. TaxID=2768039 RepID=UPI0025A9839A
HVKIGYSVRALRLHTCLIHPFERSGGCARKTAIPAGRLKEPYKREIDYKTTFQDKSYEHFY